MMTKIYTIIIFLFISVSPTFAQYGQLDSSYANNGKQNYPDFNPYLYYDKGLTIIEQSDNAFMLLGDILKTDENDQMFLPIWQFVNDVKHKEVLGKISDSRETFNLKCAVPFGGRYTNRFLIAGSRNQDVFIKKFDSDGKVDLNFGFLGEVIMDLGGNDVVRSIQLLSNGNFIVIIKTKDQLAVRRLKSDGSWDLIFGDNGQVDIPVIGDFKIFSSVNSKDEIFFNTGPNQICKMSKAGEIDLNYNTSANLYLDLTTSHLLALDDGSLIVSGNEFVEQQSMIMYKLTPEGTQDNSFGSFGKTVVRYNGKYNTINKVISFGSRLYVSGDIDQDIFIGQFSNTGISVPTFGINGKTIIEFGSSLSYGLDMRITNNGKALIAGMRQDWLGLTRVVLSENPVISGSGSQVAVCRGEQFQLFGAGGVSYHWIGNDGFESFENNPLVIIPDTFPGSSVTYRVRGFNADGFNAEAIVVVDVKPVISVTYEEQIPCFGANNGHRVTIFKNQFYDEHTQLLFDENKATLVSEDPDKAIIEFGEAAGPLQISFNDTLERYCASSFVVEFKTLNEIEATLETTSVDSTCISVVTPLDETGPLSFQWSNGSTTKIASEIPAGPFSVTITNTLTGCSATFEGECEKLLSTNSNLFNAKNIYPNPAIDLLNIVFDDSNDKNNIQIFNSNGIEMINLNTSDATTNIDITELKPGIYFLKATSLKGQATTGKFIKM